MICVIPVLKHEVKEIPNRPISIHLSAHQGQLIMEAGTKTTIHRGACRNTIATLMFSYCPIKASSDGVKAGSVKVKAC